MDPAFLTLDEVIEIYLVLGVASGFVSKPVLTQAFAELCRPLD